MQGIVRDRGQRRRYEAAIGEATAPAVVVDRPSPGCSHDTDPLLGRLVARAGRRRLLPGRRSPSRQPRLDGRRSPTTSSSASCRSRAPTTAWPETRPPWLTCQDVSLADQLQAGIRVLDIRCQNDFSAARGTTSPSGTASCTGSAPSTRSPTTARPSWRPTPERPSSCGYGRRIPPIPSAPSRSPPPSSGTGTPSTPVSSRISATARPSPTLGSGAGQDRGPTGRSSAERPYWGLSYITPGSNPPFNSQDDFVVVFSKTGFDDKWSAIYRHLYVTNAGDRTSTWYRELPERRHLDRPLPGRRGELPGLLRGRHERAHAGPAAGGRSASLSRRVRDFGQGAPRLHRHHADGFPRSRLDPGRHQPEPGGPEPPPSFTDVAGSPYESRHLRDGRATSHPGVPRPHLPSERSRSLASSSPR